MKHKIELNYDKNQNNLLTKLGLKYGSDKGTDKDFDMTPFGWKYHKYTDVYNLLFSHCRKNIENFFEIGIGTNNPSVLSSMGVNGKPGASLRMWRDYFPNAKIFGADIDKDILFEEERIKTFEVDQTNPESIRTMWSNINNDFDVILDDGLHTADANICFFENSFHKVRQGGVYIIEDMYKHFVDIVIKYLEDNGYHFMYFNLVVPEDNKSDDRIIVIFKD